MKYITPNGWRCLNHGEKIILGDRYASYVADCNGGSKNLREFDECFSTLDKRFRIDAWKVKREMVIRKVEKKVSPFARPVKVDGDTITITVDKSKKIVIIIE